MTAWIEAPDGEAVGRRESTTRDGSATQGAIAAEEDAIRRENKQRKWQENGTYLTRAELEAGLDCRGCGAPDHRRTR